METVNLNNLSVDSSGRVVFSGLSSGIDAEGIVADIIAAKRLPIDSIEIRIAKNEDQIAALGDLRALLTSLRQSLTYNRLPERDGIAECLSRSAIDRSTRITPTP